MRKRLAIGLFGVLALAAWPATARDINTGSTRSARSFSPVMYVPAHPTPARARATMALQKPSAKAANPKWLATVRATPDR